MSVKIPVEISARHIHLCQRDLEALFGRGHRLTKERRLTQADEFAAQEKVTIRYKNKEIPNVRVVSPFRSRTQLEISLTDAYNLGMKAVIRLSGELNGTPGILLIGPRGEVALKQGVIVAWRHLHLSPREAVKLGVKNRALVSVGIKGTRAMTFHNVRVRVGKDYKMSLHLDTDEGNAAGIIKKTAGELLL